VGAVRKVTVEEEERGRGLLFDGEPLGGCVVRGGCLVASGHERGNLALQRRARGLGCA